MPRFQRNDASGEDDGSNKSGRAPLSQGGLRSNLCVCHQIDFSLILTIITLILTVIGTYIIPMIRVRTYLLETDNNNPNISALLNYKQHYVEDNWAIFDYPESVDRLLQLALDVRGRLKNDLEAEEMLFGERRRLSTYWHDCFTYYPLIPGFLIVSITMHLVIRVDPLWKNASMITPYFALVIFHVAIALLQLALLFSNVKMHRGLNELFKMTSISSISDLAIKINSTPMIPLTFCMAPPTHFSTNFIINLFLNILCIFSLLDSMDSEN